MAKSENRIRITKTTVEKLPPSPSRATYYWDDRVQGFGVRVTGDTKTYVVHGYVKRSGKKSRVSLGRHGRGITTEQFSQMAIQHLRELALGVDPEETAAKEAAATRSQVTLHELYEDYKKRGGLRDKTIQIYDRILNGARDKAGNVTWVGFSDWLEKPMASITSQMVRERYRELKDHKGYRSDEGGARSAAAQAMRTLNTLFNYAMNVVRDEKDNPLIITNPVTVLGKTDPSWRKLNDRHEDVLKESDLASWYQAVLRVKGQSRRKFEDSRTANTAADAMLLCLFTGLRRGAALRLAWKNIDWEAKTIKIPPEDDKTDREQVLPMSDFVFRLLKERSSQSPVDLVYVFPGTTQQTPLQEPKRVVKQIVELSGVAFSMHTLRRTFATMAQKRELQLPYAVVKELLHHSRGRDVTAVHYTNIEVEDLRVPMQLIADYLTKRMGIDSVRPSVKSNRLKQGAESGTTR